MTNALELKPTMDYRLPLTHPHALVFLTVSGSHLFGFSSPDSDYDLRGAHLCRTRDVLSLERMHAYDENVVRAEPKGAGSEEMVTHELRRFMELLIKNAGNLLEQVLSPHVIFTSAAHELMRAVAPEVLSQRHLRHYLGFANSQIILMTRRPDKETKIFLYIFRTLMTGIVAAREGVIEANLQHLVERWDGPFAVQIRKLIAWKQSTAEEMALYHEFSPTVLWNYVRSLEDELKAEIATTELPAETPADVVHTLNDILLHARDTVGR